MTNSIKDVCEDSQVILLVGSNPEEAHPVMGMRLRQAVERGAKLIVVDPREIGLAKKADIHLKLRPGTNVAFANGMVNVLIRKGLVDREFVEGRTEGFDELAAMVADYTPERVAEICGIDARDLEAAAEMYATAERAPIVYCLGVVEHSTGTEGLNQIDGTSFIEINDADAAAAGIADGDRVRVSSRRGVIESQARVSGKTNPGEVWMPFHFQDGNANWLTNAALDNISATPEYKVCAVRVEKA